METCYSQTLVKFYQTSRRHIQKDRFLHLKSNRISEVSICGYYVLAYRWLIHPQK